MRKNRFWSLIWSCATAAALSGCSLFKADPAKPSKFLDDGKTMAKDPSAECYHKVWVDPSISDPEWERFENIHVAPVDTQHLRKMKWWDKINSDIDRENSIKNLADYTRSEFIKAHRNNPTKRLKVVEKPNDKTLILELAITEVIPTKVWLNAAGYAFIYTALDQGIVAIEGRVRDAKSGKVVAKFMDREKGRTSLLNLKDLTWYEHGKGVITEWADQSVELVNADQDDVVEDTCPFTLMPW